MSEENKEVKKKEKPQPSKLWIIGTDGKPSMSATFATVAFLTTTAVYIASIFEKIGKLSIRPFDPTVCAAYLMPVLMLYFGRRHDENKFGQAAGQQDKKEG
jgi:hypothetical protein